MTFQSSTRSLPATWLGSSILFERWRHSYSRCIRLVQWLTMTTLLRRWNSQQSHFTSRKPFSILLTEKGNSFGDVMCFTTKALLIAIPDCVILLSKGGEPCLMSWVSNCQKTWLMTPRSYIVWSLSQIHPGSRSLFPSLGGCPHSIYWPWLSIILAPVRLFCSWSAGSWRPGHDSFNCLAHLSHSPFHAGRPCCSFTHLHRHRWKWCFICNKCPCAPCNIDRGIQCPMHRAGYCCSYCGESPCLRYGPIAELSLGDIFLPHCPTSTLSRRWQPFNRAICRTEEHRLPSARCTRRMLQHGTSDCAHHGGDGGCSWRDGQKRFLRALLSGVE